MEQSGGFTPPPAVEPPPVRASRPVARGGAALKGVVPLLARRTLADGRRRGASACARCLKRLGTRAQQLAWAARLPAPPPDARADAEGYHGWRCACGGGCGAVYCSLACREEDWGICGHRLLCTGPHDEAHPLVELARAARGSHEAFGAVAAALAAAASGGEACADAVARLGALRRPGVAWWDLQAAGMAPKRARRVAAECRAQAAEAHAMFRVGLQYEGAVPVESAALRQGEWLGLLAALEACRVPLALPPPALDHCMERLAAIEGGEAPPGDAERLVVALEAAARFATEDEAAADLNSESDSDEDYESSDYDASSSDDNREAGSDGNGGVAAAEPHPGAAAGAGTPEFGVRVRDAGEGGADASVTAAARAERRCRDLLASWRTDVASLCPLRGVDAVGLLPAEAQLRHSCVPNCQLEARWEPLLASAAEREAAARAAGEGEMRYDAYRGRVTVSAIALRDVAEGDELTLAMVATNVGVEERAAALAARGLPRSCGCARCAFERANKDPAAVSAASDLRVLADLATEEGRHNEAAALHAERQARAERAAGSADTLKKASCFSILNEQP